MTFPTMDLPPKIEKPLVVQPAPANLLPKTHAELVQLAQAMQDKGGNYLKEIFRDPTPEETARYNANAEAKKAEKIKSYKDMIDRNKDRIAFDKRWLTEGAPALLSTWDLYVKQGKVTRDYAEIEKAKIIKGLHLSVEAIQKAEEAISKYQAEIDKLK